MNPVPLEYVYGPGQMSWTKFKQLKAVVGAIHQGFDNSAHEAAHEAAMQIIASKTASEIEDSLSAHEDMSEELSELTSAIGELHDTQTTLGLKAIDSLGEIESNLHLISGTLGQIRGDLGNLSNSVDRLTGTVIVGFALGAIGIFALWKRITAINDALRNPEKNWADEQFRTAED